MLEERNISFKMEGGLDLRIVKTHIARAALIYN